MGTEPARGIDELSRAIADALSGHREVAAAYLYGSAARGGATPISDVDVAVLPEEHVPDGRRGELIRELITLLERGCSGLRVEVRLFDELPVAVRGRVVSEGSRVLDRNPARRVAEEVRARMEYHDFLPFERAGTWEALRALRQRNARG
ncbi:MAG: nucleotidyltransferase domain-containing protein [Gemmatimonadota bacterium]